MCRYTSTIWRCLFGTSHCLLDAGRKRQQEAPKEAAGGAKRGSGRPKRGSANWMVSVVHKLCMHDTNYLPYIEKLYLHYNYDVQHLCQRPVQQNEYVKVN